MENQSLSDSHSLTGNSGLLGLGGGWPKFKPVRVKALMEMLSSDEEDTDDRGKQSDAQSEGEDVEEANETPKPRSAPAEQISKATDNVDRTEREKIPDRRLDVQRELRHRSSSPNRDKSRGTESVRPSDGFQSTDNFVGDKSDDTRLGNHKSSSLPAEGSSAVPFAGSSAPKSSMETKRRSNPTFRAPERLHCSTNKCSYTLITSKSECSALGGHTVAKSKIDTSESAFFSNERHSHVGNVGHNPEAPPPTSSAAATIGPAMGHLQLDTPIKNNPPVGSLRPTPSLSHRTMFQTPQSSKLHHQELAKNREQTPGTIFGNWSQRHMAQTPLQTRSSILSNDSVRVQTPSILGSQHTATPAPEAGGSTRETPWYRGTGEKKAARRPLGESMQSAVNHQHHSQTEKPSSHYVADSSVAPSKHRESTDGPQPHGPREPIRDKPSNTSVQQHQLGHRESKENRHPSPLIEKSTTKEDEPAGRGNYDGVKESLGLSSKQNVSNENRSEAARPRLEVSDAPASRVVRSNSSAMPKNTGLPGVVEKNDAPARRATVQLSVPSGIRRAKQGETMVVGGKEYLILGTLGEGMSGQVLRVQDLTSLELRAIKVVNLIRMDKDCAQGCLQEISMLHKLQAPCVVRMFDYEIQYPIVHVVMEMGDTDFRSLLNSMSEKKRLPLTMILYYWTEMLTAVKHIHDNGVIHSDLKPANFLLVRGRLKLIDFGISSSMNADMTSVVKSSPTGTLNYISPEAVMEVGSGGSGGDSPNDNLRYKITFKSDVWSLGCILYSLVYGYTPFGNIRAQWAKLQAITDPNPKISFGLPAGNGSEPPPPVLIDVMRKCLQHDPKARPTVEQLLQIPYIPTKPVSRTTIPDIPSNIVVKIRQSLTDDEWRQFTEIMEVRRNQS